MATPRRWSTVYFMPIGSPIPTRVAPRWGCLLERPRHLPGIPTVTGIVLCSSLDEAPLRPASRLRATVGTTVTSSTSKATPSTTSSVSRGRWDADQDAEWHIDLSGHQEIPQYWFGSGYSVVKATAARLDMVGEAVCHWGASPGNSCGTIRTIHLDPGNVCGPGAPVNDCAATWVRSQVPASSARVEIAGDHGSRVPPPTGSCPSATSSILTTASSCRSASSGQMGLEILFAD